MSSRSAVRSGATSRLMACSCSLVFADCRFENTGLTFASSSPAFSSASIVFANVGGCGLFAIASISLRCCAMPSLIAGRKCSGLISSNGGTPNGVVHSLSSGLDLACGRRRLLAREHDREARRGTGEARRFGRSWVWPFGKGQLGSRGPEAPRIYLSHGFRSRTPGVDWPHSPTLDLPRRRPMSEPYPELIARFYDAVYAQGARRRGQRVVPRPHGGGTRARAGDRRRYRPAASRRRGAAASTRGAST